MQADTEFPRQFGAGTHERIAAMMRDGRRHGRTYLLAVEAPILEHLAHGGKARLVG